jgi:outer membrane lipoprotein-sorting protein
MFMPARSAHSDDEVQPRGDRRPHPRRVRRVLLALLAMAAGAAPPAGGDPPTATGPAVAGDAALRARLADFAAMPGLSARFREEKHMTLLVDPIVSHGDIAFAPPDRLRRHVTDPVESLMLIRDGEMVIRDPEGTRRIDLASQPMVKIFVDGIMRLLAGDLDGLRSHYRMRFDPGDGGPAAQWSLRLEPTVSPLDGVIASLSFTGRGRALSELIVVETSGDETRTRFSEVDAERHFAPEELLRLFRSPGP